MAHGLGIGTDRSKGWVFLLAVVCGASVVIAAFVRGLDLLAPRGLAR
jgi:hypothetical protein